LLCAPRPALRRPQKRRRRRDWLVRTHIFGLHGVWMWDIQQLDADEIPVQS
ncbi:hypothetical protein NEOLEDRAFT_1142551, partial [Neolentinus lepideus HHB14362 ss-1]